MASATTSQQRLDHTTACLPIAYGSIAFLLGKKAAENQYTTHEWTLYLRGPNGEDISPAIEKVVFQLHTSFEIPTREITKPPYEVTERGWGEFEAQIHIHWNDPSERLTAVRRNYNRIVELVVHMFSTASHFLLA
jgi:YEATS domain-containing protein 4